MGYDEQHLYMRFVQMEFASHKDDAGKPPPIFITSCLEDESLLDRYVYKQSAAGAGGLGIVRG